MCSSSASGAAAASAAVGPVVMELGSQGTAAWRYSSVLGLGALGGGSAAAVALVAGKTDEEATTKADGVLLTTSSLPWLKRMVGRPEVDEVLAPGQMLRKHPIVKQFVDQDHLFETMAASGQIREFRCFYNRDECSFHSVVALGRDVCGFPQTVHGGLTAAIVDETLGGLGVCVWRAGALGFRPPAYTARLELDYKRKIPAGSVIVTSTRVEQVADRKIWMTAVVSNGEGVEYATARALFVAPKLQSVLLGWIPGVGSK
ncbi:hypothetical protein FOA52_000688 [Chlamydomonas sp. UWO 241]|nr:hypothetical protein FOA52_000688 [Chlamydomonas sp. UWO 241]